MISWLCGKRSGAEQVALPDLDAVDAELPGGDVEQPLADEHAVLPARAAHRRDDRSCW